MKGKIQEALSLAVRQRMDQAPPSSHSLRASASQLQSFKVPMWTLFCRNYCRCSLLAHSDYKGYHFWGIASLVALYRSSSNPNRKLHMLWLMPAPGRCQSVDDWTIVSYSSQGPQDQQLIAVQPPRIIMNKFRAGTERAQNLDCMHLPHPCTGGL